MCVSWRGHSSCPTSNAYQLVPSRVSECHPPASSSGRGQRSKDFPCEHWGEGRLGGSRLPWLCSPSCSLSFWCEREESAAKGPALFAYFTRVFLYLLQAAPSSPNPAPQSSCKLFLCLQWPEKRLGQTGSRITGGTKVAVILKMSL